MHSGADLSTLIKDTQFPFLFKILSFEKALPLQSHPDKALGQKLMEQEKMQSWLGRNETFVDPNHKPEVAVVLSDRFVGFVGFRPLEEIQQFVRDVAELQEAIGEENARRFVDLEAQEARKKVERDVW